MVIGEFCIRSDGHHHIRIHLHNCTFLLGLCIGSLLRNHSGDDGDVRGDDHIHKHLLRNRSGDDGGVRGDDHIHKRLLRIRSGDDGDDRDGGHHVHNMHIHPFLHQEVQQH